MQTTIGEYEVQVHLWALKQLNKVNERLERIEKAMGLKTNDEQQEGDKV